MRDDFQLTWQLATYYHVFQTEVAPINNPLVRKALSYAVDREALAEGVTKAGQIPAWGAYDELRLLLEEKLSTTVIPME